MKAGNDIFSDVDRKSDARKRKTANGTSNNKHMSDTGHTRNASMNEHKNNVQQAHRKNGTNTNKKHDTGANPRTRMSISEATKTFLEWLYDHPRTLIVIGIICLIVGILINRYISFGAAIIILLIGWMTQRLDTEDNEHEVYAYYIVSFLVFLIPYLF